MEKPLDQLNSHAALSSHVPSKLFATKVMIEMKRTDFGHLPSFALTVTLCMENNTVAAVILANTWTSKYFQDPNARVKYHNFKKSTSDALMNAIQWQTSTTLIYHSRREERSMQSSWLLSNL